nr:DUF1043 family protein [Motiliproteus sediminis]
MSTLWIVGVIALLIGAVIGLLIARSSSGGQSREALIEELNDARREMEEYKQEVSVHFAQTADLVNRLTDSYRDVHQHLSKSAQKLCDDETLVASLMAQEQRPVLTSPATDNAEEQTDTAVEAPKDYAPKAPDDEGTLSEQYGLKRKTGQESEEEPFDPTKVADHVPDDAATDDDQKARS